jgi:hypothetical protein
MMTVSAGYSNQYPIYATPTSSKDVTLNANTIVKVQNTNTANYIGTVTSYPFAYLSCNAMFFTAYNQFVGLSSTGPTGNNFGFLYYTDNNLYVSIGGALTLSLGPLISTNEDPLVRILLSIEISSTGIVFYYNGLVVYTTPYVSNMYTGAFKVTQIYDIIGRIEFGYFCSSNIPLWSAWTNSGDTGAGVWYNATGIQVTDFSSGTAYFNPTSLTANAKNNFTLTQPAQNGRMVVPINGLWNISWTIGGLSNTSNYNCFISVNSGNGNDNLTYSIYAMTNTNGRTHVCLSTTLNLLITDYISFGIFILTGDVEQIPMYSGSVVMSRM